MSSPLPTSLGQRFQVEEALPETPFERTFRARDAVLQREVLLKLPARDAFDGWTAPVKERLLREARALARIRHANVAPIHHVEETPEGPLLVLDLPQGESLAERLRHGTLDVAETIAMAVQVGDALAHVHQQNVVHRAVGPSTVRMLANGQVQLGSFTFAKEFGGARGTSLVNLRGGANHAARANHLPEYPAPEQVAGQTADPRADVFALGCTMFRCLSGRDPFPPGTEHAQLPDLQTLRKEVGRPLAEVVRKCMAFAKSARYATALEVVAALRAIAEPRVRSARGGLLLAVALGIATVGAVGWTWLGSSGNSAPVDRTSPSGLHVGYQRAYSGSYDRVHGLFVAIGESYDGQEWPRLVNPRKEVAQVVAQLRANDPAWTREGAIVVLEDGDATADRIRAELKKLIAVGENDAVMVWFAGHGARDGRSFALCAKDARGDVGGGGMGYIHDDELLNFSDRCGGKHVLVVLDCCHSGAVFESTSLGKARGREAEADPTPGATYRRSFSREFLCSAGSKERAFEGQAMSPFCEALLEQLRQPATAERGFVIARHLATCVEQRMTTDGGRFSAMQTPRFKALEDQEGSFVFLLAPGK